MSNVIKFPIDRKVDHIAKEISNLQEEIADLSLIHISEPTRPY